MITARPVTVTTSMITASSVASPDTGETAWSGATTYALGATMSYTIDGYPHKFESRQAGNLNHLPTAYPDDATNTWWLDLGYTNRYAAFQSSRNTQTVTASPYTVTINPSSRVGAVGVGTIDADTVAIDVYDGATLVHTETQSLLTRDVYDWYTWTFTPFDQLNSALLDNLPLGSTNTINLTFTRSVGSVGVGNIILGLPYNIGNALYGANIKRLNFSTFERDEFGDVKITLRKNIPKVSYQLIIDKDRINGIKRTIDELNGVVTMWAGIVESEHGYFDSVFLIGLYRDFYYSLDYPDYAKATIEIEAI